MVISKLNSWQIIAKNNMPCRLLEIKYPFAEKTKNIEQELGTIKYFQM